MSNTNKQHDVCIDENKENLTIQIILSEQESQEQALSNYSTQNDQQNLVNFDYQEDISAIVEHFKVSIKKGQWKDQISKNIHKTRLKKTQYKKKVKRIKEFQLEEDIKLLNLVHQHGRQFSRIVKQFPKRTVSMLKNRYYKNLRYRWEELMGIEYTQNEYESKTENQVNRKSGDNNFVKHQDLINMIPDSYSCPIICDMLSTFITKMDQFLKFQF
ncbi:unnamed protein product [Paramecium pentaurelia]|uniref:HTH myb-type domain-containing protein n=1 Tax=Paramecium pentaurelia TaxID=43138 RepID=A0A8S1SFI5_9CILI|nr:unnamed protein product [Paramecium pentaurelia]